MGIIAKQSIRGTIVTYLGVAVGFLTTFFVITRFLTAEEIGLARVLIDAATLFIGLAQLGTSASTLRFYPYFVNNQQSDISNQTSDNEHGFFFWTLLVPMIGFLLVSLLFIICYAPLSQWFSEKSPLFVNYYYLVLPLAFFMLYQTVFETNANVRMQIVVPRAVRELFTRVGLLVVYLLYAFDVLTMDGFVWSLVGVYALAALCNAAYLFSLGNVSLKPDIAFLRQNKPLVRKYLYYTGFVILATVVSILAPTLSSFFITAEMGLSYTGIFAIATYIAMMVSIPYRSLTAIASPQLSMAIKNNDNNEAGSLIAQVSGTLLLIGGLILATIWVNIDLIFAILPNGETYAVARRTVLMLGIGQLSVATFQFVYSALSYSRNYPLSLLFSFVLTALSLILNNLFIPRWGIDGAALATLISQVSYYLLGIIAVRFTLGFRIITRRHLLTIVLLILLFAANWLALRFIPISNIWLNSIVRSLLIILTAWLAYRWQISPELNEQLHALLHRVRL
ncbi:MAG: polysaccharide biosynthesis C-terminal domain-containing protein [Paludibacteraceae bacterium]|nr:polysaccharide biosynthesis C-terminal domain-containing protein [Paludibacteraceae bacterium]